MNVLQINLSDYTSTGGTGIAMHGLQVGLKPGGYQSKIFCLVPELGVRPGITGLLTKRENVEELRDARRLRLKPYRIVATVNEYKMPCDTILLQRGSYSDDGSLRVSQSKNIHLNFILNGTLICIIKLWKNAVKVTMHLA